MEWECKEDISYSKQLSHAVLTTTILTPLKLPLELMQFCTMHFHSVYWIFLFCIPRTLKLVRVMQKVLEIDFFFFFSWFAFLSKRKRHLTSWSFTCVTRTKRYFSQTRENKLPQAFWKVYVKSTGWFAVTGN